MCVKGFRFTSISSACIFARMKNITAHASSLRFDFYSTLVAAVALFAGTSREVLAQGAPMVIRGQEILISANLDSRGEAPRIPPLALGSTAQVMASVGDGSLGTLALDTSTPAGPIEAVPANVNEIMARCQQIIARNPRASIECEPNFLSKKYATPNDEYFPQMYNLKQISAPRAWDISTGSKDMVVAVVDTGIDYGHVEIAQNIFVNSGETPGNRIDDDHNGLIDDYYGYDFANRDSDPMDDDGHGTHVAGTIGAASNNQVGVAGVAWNVSLLPVKVLGQNGWGTNSQIAAGIRYAVSRGANVINLSLGGDRPSAAFYKALVQAMRKDVIVVVAAGNAKRNIDRTPDYPTSYGLDNIISVAATNALDEFSAGYSNFGANTVDVAAPGNDILSLAPGPYLAIGTGTSMSAPHVSGVAAVMRAVNPTLSFAETKTIVMNTVDQRPTLSGRVKTAGRINFARALQGAVNNLRNPPAPARIISASASRSGTVAKISGTVLSRYRLPLAGEWTNLICNGQGVSKEKTGAGGYYEYRFNIARGTSYSCYVEDDRGSRSGQVQVR